MYVGNVIAYVFMLFWDFLNVFIMFYVIYGTWEARASSRHTNLAIRIDPPTPKHPKTPKPKKSVFPKIIFSDPVVIRFLFSSFFEKVDLIWLLRPNPSVEMNRIWIL